MKGVSYQRLSKVALELAQDGQIVLVLGTIDADYRRYVAVQIDPASLADQEIGGEHKPFHLAGWFALRCSFDWCSVYEPAVQHPLSHGTSRNMDAVRQVTDAN